MRLFNCQNCGAMVFFENRSCGQCGLALGFVSGFVAISALAPCDGGVQALAERPGADGARLTLRLCANAAHDVCNWLVPFDSTEDYCVACRHNRIVPRLTDARQGERWLKLEIAKHRMLYSLIRLGIALPNRADDPENGLAFDFLDEFPGGPRVLTGHENGLITIAVKEADDAVREELRHRMHETYRTLLGHFRHEVGHWIWDRLVRDAGELDACRALFGDDTLDYQQGLHRHYAEGPPHDWQQNFITAYASSHPWEDFAETWAHYLHIMDTLETAGAFRLSIDPAAAPDGTLAATIDLDPYLVEDFDRIIDTWMPLVFAVNNLNRSMGLADLYPFVISAPVRAKLGFIHRIARRTPAA